MAEDESEKLSVKKVFGAVVDTLKVMPPFAGIIASVDAIRDANIDARDNTRLPTGDNTPVAKPPAPAKKPGYPVA